MTGDCHRISSPTAKGINNLLWGDWKRGEVGLLARMFDRFDNPGLFERMQKTSWPKGLSLDVFNIAYLPASFLHASLRASNSLLVNNKGSVGFIVGSRFGINRFDDRTKGAEVVEALACYAADAGTYKRNALIEENQGMSCHPESPPGGICINGTCLYDNDTCQCNRQVSGNLYGEILSQWITEKADTPFTYMCAYPGDRHGISEMVDASNSLWMERRRWSIRNDQAYQGYTECPVTNNMRRQDMVDAIVIRLPLSEKHGTTLCDYRKRAQFNVQTSLAKIHKMGFQSLPVVVLEQAKGMPNRTECNTMWGGIECINGYRKEIFAQTHFFDDGSCLAMPEGCMDVYYFPADGNRSCTVSSNVCMQLERSSPFNQVVTGNTDSSSSLLTFFPGSTPYRFDSSTSSMVMFALPILIFMVGILGGNQLARKRRASSSFSFRRTCLLSAGFCLLPLLLLDINLSSHLVNDKNLSLHVDILKGQNPVYGSVVPALSSSNGNDTSMKPSNNGAIAKHGGLVACPNVLPENTRLILLSVVQANHESTALMSLFMSSTNISTFCPGRTWKCEGFRKAMKFACPNKTMCLRDKRQLPPAHRQEEPRKTINLLNLLSTGWNLTRPILHDKLFPQEPGYTKLWEESLSTEKLSSEMSIHGIEKVLPAYVMMWTPLCVMAVASKSRGKLSVLESARTLLQREVWNLQRMRQQHEALMKSRTPVLVISYADLLFRQHHTVDRMNGFLPCAGSSMNAHFTPRMGIDIFPRNKWKVRSTIHDFSSKLDPYECCGYDLKESTCSNRTYFESIPEFEEDLNELNEYFAQYS